MFYSQSLTLALSISTIVKQFGGTLKHGDWKPNCFLPVCTQLFVWLSLYLFDNNFAHMDSFPCFPHISWEITMIFTFFYLYFFFECWSKEAGYWIKWHYNPTHREINFYSFNNGKEIESEIGKYFKIYLYSIKWACFSYFDKKIIQKLLLSYCLTRVSIDFVKEKIPFKKINNFYTFIC